MGEPGFGASVVGAATGALVEGAKRETSKPLNK